MQNYLFYFWSLSPKDIKKEIRMLKALGEKGIEELVKGIQFSQLSLFNIEQLNHHDFVTCFLKNF